MQNMSCILNNHVPILPGLSVVPKRRDTPKIGPNNIFNIINNQKCNLNNKYMFVHDQFKNKNGPILKFFAYFDDRSECPRDQMKFRKCEILFFVEDGTIKVNEPHQRNAGFLQGCLINRNRIPKPDGGYSSLDNLNLGKHISLYGKDFKILDCDPFTKNFLKEMGYKVGTPEPVIIDPVYADRQEMDLHRTSRQRPRSKPVYKSAEFYRSHPKCLHFYAIYNYKPGHFDEIRYASLYYNIWDNTIKITDEKKLLEYKRQLSTGNYDTCLILRPTLVPKKMVGVNPLGKNYNPVILNLSATSRRMQLQQLMSCHSGGLNNLAGFLRDSNPETSEEFLEYYTAEDLDLGKTLDIFGYEVYIYNCDEFTKEFYRNKFNKELIPVPLPEIKEEKYLTLVYKENFGNPEDSLQTCQQLPSVNISQKLMDVYIVSERPCHKGFRSDYLIKFYLNCRLGCDSKILTYLALVITNEPFLKDQYFVIRFYLEDGSIDIAGLDSITFSQSTDAMYMKRKKITKPTSEMENSGTCYYSAKDMFVGNIIYALKKPFLIVDADDYTFDYMERNCHIFLHSNIKYVMSHFFPIIRNEASKIKSSCETRDFENTGFISYDDFKKIIIEIVPQSLKQEIPEQQIITLARHFAYEEYVGFKIEQLISRIQSELKKQRFEDFEKLELLFRLFDVDNTDHQGHFAPPSVYEILRSYPLLIDRDLLKSFVLKFPQCNGLISFEAVVKSLNYFENPSEPPDLTPYAININWERVERMKNLNKIPYSEFLKVLTNEKCPNCK